VTGAPFIGSRDQPQAWTPWLRHLAADMLDCALRPVIDGAHAEALLASAALLDDGTALPRQHPQADGRGFALRAALVATAEALLQRPDPATDSQRWRLSAQAFALACELMELPGTAPSEANLAQMRHALGLMASEPPDRLAADMRRYRDEPLELLVDAPLQVRLAAAAWRLASDGMASLAAVASLLEQDESSFAGRLQRVMVWASPPADDRSEEALLRSIARFRALESVLLPMAEAESPAAALATMERLLPPWLGQAVMPLWLDDDGYLTLHGGSDLAGQRLRCQGSLSLAAKAIAGGELTVQQLAAGPAANARVPDTSVTATVFDRQCAERLGASALVAVSVGAPQPIAVLLTSADAKPEDLQLVAVHADRWLQRLAGQERRLRHEAAGQRAEFMRRVREAAHEISNPLSVIHNCIYLLGTRIDGDDPGQEQVRLISEELRRAASLLRALSEDDSPGAGAADGAEDPGDINALVSEVLALIERSLGPDVAVEVRFTPGIDLPAVAILDQRLHQVLLNLARNALEAMPDGGILDVVVDQAVNARGRPGVEIRVSDTGAGIDPTLLPHIFESGVSIKGEGRGLGLAITSRLVHELGGEMSCRSRLGSGTSFVVWLPAA
jgi:signal transduction histidine kinase